MRGGGRSALKRRKATRLPKKKILIFTEGKNTEPDYFQGLSKYTKNTVLELKIFPGQGVPSTLFKSAMAETKKRGKQNSFEANDECWIVFDRDDHPCFFETINNCSGTRVSPAFSNPCFELWLLLHFEDQDAPDDRKIVQKKLSKRCKNYSRSSGKRISFDEFSGSVNLAITRAEKMRERRMKEGKDTDPPSTSVYSLVKKIIE